MNRANIPTVAQTKLRALEERVEHLAAKLAKAEDGIASTRSRLSGAFAKSGDYDVLTATLNDLVADRPILDRRLHGAKLVVDGCNRWLDELPDGTVLEPLEVNVEGHDLAQVRVGISRTEMELKALRAVPTPSPNIEQRIHDYVNSMGKPDIRGIGKGEHLEIVWPGSGFDERGPCTDRADVLPLMAMLFPNEMTNALMRQVEADPAAIAARQKKIAELETKLEALQRQALALGEDVSDDFPPAVLLGVRVVERERRSSRAA